MDEQTRLAVEFQGKIRALAKEYKKYDNLEVFASHLMEVVEELDECMDEVRDVE